MTQSHFITGTTLTLLLAVAVLGNAPSATAEATDATDIARSSIDTIAICHGMTARRRRAAMARAMRRAASSAGRRNGIR